MKTIAIWNRKGGTGKTTVAGNVAAYMGDHGRVLLVDSDPQGNLTSWLAGDYELELADVLNGKATIEKAAKKVVYHLDIIPTFAIGGELNTFAETKLPALPFAIDDLKIEAERAGYDYLVFDMAPGDSILQRSTLATADEVILVASAEYFAADGLESAIEILNEVRRTRRAQFNVRRLVVNRLNKTYASHDVFLTNFKESGFELYQIGQNTRIHDAVMFHGTIKEWDPGNKFAPVFQSLAGAIT